MNQQTTQRDDRGVVPRSEERSVRVLLRELRDEAELLVRKEVQLATTEMNEKVGIFQRNVITLLAGGAVLIAALLVLATAINRGLTVLFQGFMPLETAVWLAPVVFGVALVIIGIALVMKARRAIERESLVPHRTIESFERSQQWAERKVQS